MIVQADSVAAAKTAVLAVGGSVLRELDVINAVGAELTEDQRAALQETTAVTALYDNQSVTTASSGSDPVLGVATDSSSPLRSPFLRPILKMAPPRVGDLAGNVTLKNVNEAAQSGARSLKVTGRTAGWNGPNLNVLGTLQPGTLYEISGYVKLAAGQSASQMMITMQRKPVGGNISYDRIVTSAVNGVTSANWVFLQGQYTFDTAVSGLDIYVESTNNTAAFYLDKFTITKVLPPPTDPIVIGGSSSSVFDIQFIGDNTLRVAIKDKGWPAAWNSYCINSTNCMPGVLQNGYYVRSVPATLGQTYQIEFKVQDPREQYGFYWATDSVKFVSIGSVETFGVEYVNDTTMRAFHVNNGWTAQWNYFCLDGNCVPGTLVNGRYEHIFNNVNLGQTYHIEFNVQDNALSQYRASDTFVYVVSGETNYGHLIKADVVHNQGITGRGVGVAVIDTGYFNLPALNEITPGVSRVVHYNAITGQQSVINSDGNGHGTHIASIILNHDKNADGTFKGVAPEAQLISIKAFADDGTGNYLNLINAINWVVQNKQTYNIRVLNLSFSAAPKSFYWADPLNQAVMAAWRAGIVVVASAGNLGPEPFSIGVPGNVPYIITVGAVSDNYTPQNTTDDFLATFSGAGPTVEAFVKPDLLAPGGHIVGLMDGSAQIAQLRTKYHTGNSYFMMSGTSQATAVTSGVVALMLQAYASPDSQ